MEFTDEVLTAAAQGLNRIKNCHRNLIHAEKNAKRDPRPLSRNVKHWRGKTTLYYLDFINAMDDDFNTPDAVTVIHELVTFINTQLEGDTSLSLQALKNMRLRLEYICSILGIVLAQDEQGDDTEIEALIQARQDARAAKNFAESDRIRDELAAQGIILEDTPQGPRWHRA